MKRTAYQPADVFVPAGKTYSHGVIVEAGRTLYVAGQTPRDVHGNIVCKGDAAGEKRSAGECQYAVAGELTAQARAYAKQKGVKLVEGAELARLVRA